MQKKHESFESEQQAGLRCVSRQENRSDQGIRLHHYHLRRQRPKAAFHSKERKVTTARAPDDSAGHEICVRLSFFLCFRANFAHINNDRRSVVSVPVHQPTAIEATRKSKKQTK